MDKVKKVIHSK